MTKTTIASKEEVRALMKEHFKTNWKTLGFYTSQFDRIIKDEDLMVVPIYNRQVHRAHSIFDTVDVEENKLILLDEHLARLEVSCKLVEIPLPLPLQTIKEKIIDLASFCITTYNLENKPFSMRYWVSSGGENFGILPSGKPVLYVVAFISPQENVNVLRKEYSIQSIDPKIGVLASSKTTNYLVNALFAMEASRKGGFLGVMATKEGIVLEGPVMNVGFIWRNGDFVTSTFERTLKGTTLIECMNFIKEQLVPSGKVRRIVQRDFTLQEVYENAVEMMEIGGNFIMPIGTFDDRVISTEVGPITKILQENFLKRVLSRAEPIPLTKYKKLIPNAKL